MMLTEVVIARLHWLRNKTEFNTVTTIDEFMSDNSDIIKQIKTSIQADYNINMIEHTFIIRDAIKLYLTAEGIKLK